MKNEMILIKLEPDSVDEFCNACRLFNCDVDLIDGSQTFDAKDYDSIRLIDCNKPLCVYINTNDKNEILRFNSHMHAFV